MAFAPGGALHLEASKSCQDISRHSQASTGIIIRLKTILTMRKRVTSLNGTVRSRTDSQLARVSRRFRHGRNKFVDRRANYATVRIAMNPQSFVRAPAFLSISVIFLLLGAPPARASFIAELQ